MKTTNWILKMAGFAILGSLVGSFSLAKVDNFHSLIQDNISAQKELHQDVKKQMKTSQQAFKDSVENRPATTMVVESEITDVNSVTSKRALRFQKEKSVKQISRKKQMDRLSQEFNEAETQL